MPDKTDSGSAHSTKKSNPLIYQATVEQSELHKIKCIICIIHNQYHYRRVALSAPEDADGQ